MTYRKLRAARILGQDRKQIKKMKGMWKKRNNLKTGNRQNTKKNRLPVFCLVGHKNLPAKYAHLSAHSVFRSI